MLMVIGILLSIMGILIIFFNIPGSKLKSEFDFSIRNLTTEAKHQSGLYREEDMADLPVPVSKYFRYCGYIGTPKISYIKIAYQDVDFSFSNDTPKLKMDYTQYNFVNEPDRIAYIDSSLYGIPFEGLDTFIDGSGSMKGILAKVYTLFHQTGPVMDGSCLVTFLSEILFNPSAVFQDYITWEAIDDLHAKAVISCYGMSASGVFAFDEKGKMLSFITDDRSAVSTDGTSKSVRWSVTCDQYVEENGIKKPTVFQAIWHYSDGDLVYFHGNGKITGYY